MRDFYDALTCEERRVGAMFESDRFGLIMRVAINELDLELEGVHRDEAMPTDDDQERAYIMRLGVNRLIKMAMSARPQFLAPSWTIPRDFALSTSVLSLIMQLGTIDHGRRIAQSLALKVGRIERIGHGFRITLPHSVIDHELHERQLDDNNRERVRRRFEEGPQAFVEDRIGGEVHQLLTELVYPYGGRFIGYESDPKLDVYFFGRAYSEIQLSRGYDTFHFATRFGGMAFMHFQLAAVFILQAANRHRAFARALLNKEPHVRIEDILTVSGDAEGFRESMRDFINHFGEGFEGHVPVSDEGVRILFDIFSISRRNRDLLDRPGAPIPPLVQCSDEHVIKVLSGAGTDIMQFLLNSLQHSFPREYDAAQREREGVMQRGIESMLTDALPSLQFRANIKLRQRGKVLTDLDLVALDETHGRAVLFQLKHQDHYGDDLATMQARTGRLNKQVGDWLVKVRGWLAHVGASELRSVLRLSSGSSPLTITLMVVTRHFAHSLRSVVNGQDMAFANWTQLATASARLQGETSPPSLDRLIELCRELSEAEGVPHLPEPSMVYHVGELLFTLQSEPEGEPGGAPLLRNRPEGRGR
jgi:hypothetical protein